MKIVKVMFKLRFLERKTDGVLEDPVNHLPLDVLKLILKDFKVKTNKREEVILTPSPEHGIITGVYGGVVNVSFDVTSELEYKESITAVTKLVFYNDADDVNISLSNIYTIKLVAEDNENISLYPTSYSGNIDNDIDSWFIYRTDIDVIKFASIHCEYHYLVPTLDPTSATCKFCDSLCWSDGVLNYPINTDEHYHLCGSKFSDERFITTLGQEDHLVSLTSVDEESVKILNHLNKGGLKFDPDQSTIWLGTNTEDKLHSDNVKVDSISLQLTYGGAFVKTINIPVKDNAE